MTNFEHLQAMTIEELAAWLDEHGQFDSSPWMDWFSKTYCDKCESIKCKYVHTQEKLGFEPFSTYHSDIECAYCELEHKCRFFPDLTDTPSNKETIEMWLKEETKNDC